MATLIALHGDAYLCRRRYDELLAQLGQPEVITIAGNGATTPDAATEEGRILAFMEPHRVVRIEGAMASPSGGKRSTAKKNSAWASAIETLASMPESTWYIWLDEPVPKSDPTLKEIAKHGTVETHEAPKGQALQRWIKEQVAERGSAANDAACSAMAERAGDDLWRLAQECEKVALWSDDRVATASDVALLVEGNTAESVFNAVDAIFDGNPARCARTVEDLLDSGQNAYYVLTMLQREARLMSTTRQMDDEGRDADEILHALQTRSEFVLRKTRQHARQLGRAGIDAWYEDLLAADRAIKTSAMTAEQAVYWVIGALTTRLPTRT